MASQTNKSGSSDGGESKAFKPAARHAHLVRCVIVPWLIFCVGAALSVSSYYRLRDSERDHQASHFHQVAGGYAEAVRTSMEESVLAVNSLGFFVAGSRDLETRELGDLSKEFQNLAGHLLAYRPYIQALQWAPLVPDDYRASYEAAARRQAGQTFQITERQGEGGILRAGQREAYFPVHCSAPAEGNEEALGFDLGSDPTYLTAMERARDSGEAIATGRIALVHEQRHQFGYIVLQPVYRPGMGMASVQQRRQALAGFVAGVVLAGDLMDRSLRGLPAGAVDMALYDASAPPEEQFLHWHGTGGDEPSHLPAELEAGRQGGEWDTIEVTAAGRKWAIVCTPGPAFGATNDEQHLPYSVVVLLAGLSLSGLGAIYLMQLGRHAARRERLVAQVLTTNKQLSAEVDERKLAELASRAAREKAEGYLFLTGTMFVAVDADETVALINPKGCEILGCREADILGTNWFDRVVPEPGREEARAVFGKLMAGEVEAVEHFENTILAADGTERTIAWHNALLRDPDGRITGTLSSGLDITERQQAQEQLQESNDRLESLAGLDPLTDLPNRRRLLETLGGELQRVQRYGGSLSVVTLDADNLKPINDTYGHDMGDKALIALARVLETEIRDTDFVARYGGDEFVILMPNTPAAAAAKGMERIQSRIAECNVFDLKRALTITISAGISEALGNDGKTTANLLKLSDEALYAAKSEGGGCIRTWQDISDSPETDLPGDKQSEALQRRVVELMHEARDVSIQGIWSLVQALEARDAYTRGHSENVTRFAVGIAQAMDLEARDIEIIRRGAMVHDIGKIGVPDSILKKPDRLTPDELATMQAHAVAGVRILQEMRLMEQELPMVRCHHERWDGKGYPDGVSGVAIPLGARIISVADTLDAITSDRVYRKGRDFATALKIVVDEAGNQFDPDVVVGLQRWVTDAGLKMGWEKIPSAEQLLATQALATALSNDVLTT